jgi:hypothetical protein
MITGMILANALEIIRHIRALSSEPLNSTEELIHALALHQFVFEITLDVLIIAGISIRSRTCGELRFDEHTRIVRVENHVLLMLD